MKADHPTSLGIDWSSIALANKTNLRMRNNEIEARVSSLQPDAKTHPEAFKTWCEAMELLGEQFRKIQELPIR